MSQESEINLDHILGAENQHETIALARALCPFAETMTDATILIAVAMVETSGDMDAVSEYLGYEKSRLRGHCQSHLYNRVVRELSRQKLSGEGYLIAVSALMEVSKSKGASPAARNKASQTIISMVNDEQERSGRRDGEGKALNEMTLSELEDHVNKIKSDIATLSTQAIESKQY